MLTTCTEHIAFRDPYIYSLLCLLYINIPKYNEKIDNLVYTLRDIYIEESKLSYQRMLFRWILKDGEKKFRSAHRVKLGSAERESRKSLDWTKSLGGDLDFFIQTLI